VKRFTKDIAANIVKLPELLRRGTKMSEPDIGASVAEVQAVGMGSVDLRAHPTRSSTS